MGRAPRVCALHSDASRARLAMSDLDADVAENARRAPEEAPERFRERESSSREPAFLRSKVRLASRL